MKEPRPLNPTPVREVPLPNAPLARVVAQARFPPILSIRNPDWAAAFQEELRETYPHLGKEQVHRIELNASQTPNVSQDLVWRLADSEQGPRWRVSLGEGFVSLETSDYDSRQDFLDRLRVVLATVEDTFKPADAQRLGLRYISRLTDDATERVGELIRPEVLGIMDPACDSSPKLGDSIIFMMTETRFLGPDGRPIQGRWGALPPNTTYDPNTLEPVTGPSWVLDLDMATSAPSPFSTEDLLTTAGSFAESLYWLFRQMVTDEFLQFHGGEP